MTWKTIPSLPFEMTTLFRGDIRWFSGVKNLEGKGLVFFLFLSPELFQILIQVCFSPSTCRTCPLKTSYFNMKTHLSNHLDFQVTFFLVSCEKKTHYWYPTRCRANLHMGVSENSGTPKSSILIGFSIINHPFWGTPYFWKHPHGACSPPVSSPPCFACLQGPLSQRRRLGTQVVRSIDAGRSLGNPDPRGGRKTETKYDKMVDDD